MTVLYVVAQYTQLPARYVKVGVADDISRRLAQLQTGYPLPLRTWCEVEIDSREDALLCEKLVHQECHPHRRSGEWFELPLEDISRICWETVKRTVKPGSRRLLLDKFGLRPFTSHEIRGFTIGKGVA